MPLIAALLTLSGTPQPLIARQAVAGHELISVQDSSSSCLVTLAPGEVVTITASLSPCLPPQTQLTLRWGALAPLILNTCPQPVTTYRGGAAPEPVQITYEFSASAQAGLLAPSPYCILFTVLESP